MNRRFVVGASPLTKKQEIALARFFEEKGGKWWHWIPNFWLLSFDINSDIDVQKISNFIIGQNPKITSFITEVKDIDWLVTNMPLPPNQNAKSGDDWLLEFWGGEYIEEGE